MPILTPPTCLHFFPSQPTPTHYTGPSGRVPKAFHNGVPLNGEPTMARHTLMEGLRAAVSALATAAVVADEVMGVAEDATLNWKAQLAAEKAELDRALAAAQQSANP